MKAPSPAELRVYRERMSPEQLAAYDEMTNFELIFHDLERLNLLEKVLHYESGRVSKYKVGSKVLSIPSENSGITTRYALTQYGVSFILAVRPKPSGV